MAIQEVRSPNTHERERPYRDRPGTSPNSAGRADQGQGPHSAGKGWTPLDLRDGEPGPIPPVNDRRR